MTTPLRCYRGVTPPHLHLREEWPGRLVLLFKVPQLRVAELDRHPVLPTFVTPDPAPTHAVLLLKMVMAK